MSAVCGKTLAVFSKLLKDSPASEKTKPRNGFSCSSDPRLDFDRIVTVLEKICKCPWLHWEGYEFLVQ